MLEQQDLDILEQMMRRVVSENNDILRKEMLENIETLRSEMTVNLKVMRKDIDESVQREISRSESFLLDEIDRFYQLTKAEIRKLSAKVDELSAYYTNRKQDEDMCKKCFLLYQKQQREIDQIKKVVFT